MIPSEVLKKVRFIEIKTKRIVNNLFGGEYNSAFKGMGMEFSEVREYSPGDDVRAIDWNVTARTGKPFIKKYNEERELSVVLMIDISPSTFYGTGSYLKSDIIIELASVLSFSALNNNDKVGLLLFSDKIEKYIPPNKGKLHVLRVIRDILFHKSSGNSTNILNAIEHVIKVVKRKSIIFLISDFWNETNYYDSMKLLNKKHDLINIQILDNNEIYPIDIGMVKLHDIESQKSYWVDLSNKKNRDIITKNVRDKKKMLNNFCKKNKIDLISVNSKKGYYKPLEKFFIDRINRL